LQFTGLPRSVKKNFGTKVLTALQYHRDHLSINFLTNTLFRKAPLIKFRPNVSECCGQSLKILKTKTRTIYRLAIGACCIHETVLECKECNKIYSSQELAQMVPSHATFGFDVIVYVGKALYQQHRTDVEIHQALGEKNISISLREISVLGKKFIIYLAIAHFEGKEKLKHLMQSKGGYILHLDGTCEGDSAHLMSAMDEITTIVLDNIKTPSENSEFIIPMLERIKQNYGNPIACVHDMGGAILKSVANVFPGVKDFICHYHFLRDIGKDLFGVQYNNIRRYLKDYGIKGKLRKTVREMKKIIEQDPALSTSLNEYLGNENLSDPKNELTPFVAAYVLTAWVIESNSESHGFGFPFDRPHLDFYCRLREAFEELKMLKDKLPKGSPSLHTPTICKVLSDQGLTQSVSIMQDKIEVFDDLRERMRIALPKSRQGLNDNGEDDIKNIEAGVSAFRHSEKILQLAAKDFSYKKMLKQIDKYWEKLFVGPIQIETPSGNITIQPQRTNNMMEIFFRDFKSDGRKKSGAKSLNKKINAMLADTPLIKNLDKLEYMEIILDGKPNLEMRFAEIDIALVRQELKAQAKSLRKYPKGMAKVFKLRNIPKLLTRSLTRKLARLAV